jgi:putative Mg2+ transporter-C (MgtC) family protein
MTPDIHWADVLLRIAVAAALTGAIGMERELRERAAGLRTHMLVGVGSALFTIVSAYAWGDFVFDRSQGVVFDPTRIAAQIVTGIGFLGAGAIIRQGLSVRGLTTAAGLWVVAAIGMAVGAGYYSAAVIATGVVLVGLGPLRWVEGGALARWRRGGRVLEVDILREQALAPLLETLEAKRARVNRVEFEDEENRRQVRIELDLPLGPASSQIVSELSDREGVTAVRWAD